MCQISSLLQQSYRTFELLKWFCHQEIPDQISWFCFRPGQCEKQEVLYNQILLRDEKQSHLNVKCDGQLTHVL